MSSKVKDFLSFYGIKVNLGVLKGNVSGLKFYKNDLKTIIKQKGNDTSFEFGKKYKILRERSEQAGTMTVITFTRTYMLQGEYLKTTRKGI